MAIVKREEQRFESRTTIVLCATDWKQFCEALNYPPASNAALKKLMNRKSRFKKSDLVVKECL